MAYSNTPAKHKIEVDRKCIATCKKLQEVQKIDAGLRDRETYGLERIFEANDSFTMTRRVY
jgi:hypothetical protein